VTCPASVTGGPGANLLWALNSKHETLKSSTATLWAKAFALRYIIHMMGDLHEPLHCISRCSPKHPKGDMGGNLFRVNNSHYTNLHKYWDAMGGQYEAIASLCPYGNDAVCHKNEAKRAQAVDEEATTLVLMHPVSSLSAFDPDDITGFEHWARQSWQVAVDSVYTGIDNGGTPSLQYQHRTQETTRKLVVLGGHRLAVLLNDALYNISLPTRQKPLAVVPTVATTSGNKQATNYTEVSLGAVLLLALVALGSGGVCGCAIVHRRETGTKPAQAQGGERAGLTEAVSSSV